MDGLFGQLKSFFKAKPVTIDNIAFQIHYRATFVVLIAFSLLVTSKQYFGDPIDCISKDDVPSKMLDTFCWIHTTFSVENAWKKSVGVEVPYPGVDKSTPSESRVYHAYYQWVCFVLFFQALGFYVPRFLWKNWEGNLVGRLTKDMNSPTMLKKDHVEKVATYMRYTRDYNNGYFYLYVFCEMLNFVNVIFQMYIICSNKFLGGTFTTYGWDVFTFTEWDWTVRFDPMIKVFPRLSKCTFNRYGSSGDVMHYDAMCILPINIINEKIYVFLWFWFYMIAIISTLAVVYRIVTLINPNLRFQITKSKARQTDPGVLHEYIQHAKIGDWFLLDLIARNSDPLNFKALLDSITNQETKNGGNP